MIPLTNEMTSKAMVADRLRRGESARVTARLVAETRAERRHERQKAFRVLMGTRIETLGRRLAATGDPSAADQPC